MKQLEQKISYQFKNKSLLTLALTHSSRRDIISDTLEENNERIEFLGDSILGCAVTYLLFIMYPYKSEGELSKVKSQLVGESFLSAKARSISLGEHLLIGNRGQASRDNDRLLASALEALIGAVFLDSNYDKAQAFVESLFGKELSNIDSIKSEDYKSQLQENLQKEKKITPKYVLLKQDGPAHNREFTVKVMAASKVLAEGAGKSKKEAEQKAAENALRSINVL